MQNMSEKPQDNLMDKIVALCKRRGFIYPSFEIYGGFAGFYDYGPLGVALKKNITNLWWKQFVTDREDVYGVDTVELTKQDVLKASGHIDTFTDPSVTCKKCKHIYRADQLADTCLECGGTEFYKVENTNLMFSTLVGGEKLPQLAYLRPETAQGIFSNFKNVVDSFHPKLPFGIAQIGKAFRNEIAPRDFLFRVRELEQMEVEYFVREGDWKPAFEMWRKEMLAFIEAVGIDAKKVSELEVAEADRAHYSKRTIDFEFDFPFGRKELYGLAYRTNYALTNHQGASGQDLSYRPEGEEPVVPHVIEPSFGVDRTFLAVLVSAYAEDEQNGESRVYLKFKPAIAPIKAAVFPLLKNKPELVAKARDIYTNLKKDIPQIMWDDNGNVGKRYRRQDEIGTPYCITVDFDTLG